MKIGLFPDRLLSETLRHSAKHCAVHVLTGSMTTITREMTIITYAHTFAHALRLCHTLHFQIFYRSIVPSTFERVACVRAGSRFTVQLSPVSLDFLRQHGVLVQVPAVS